MRVTRGVTVALVAGVVLAPIAVGFAQLLLTAADHAPALGRIGWSVEPLRQFLATPGLMTALRLTMVSGVGATALSLAVAFFLAGAILSGPRGRVAGRLLAPVLAIPHAALAIGFGFVIAPSGWITRMLSTVTGWAMPPDIVSVNDPWGLALMAGLVLKETAFLTMSLLAVLGRFPLEQTLKSAASLGYDRASAWVWLVLPQVYGLIRLPVFAVLSYALSVADMSLILGPSQPPTLAVLILRLFSAPDLKAIFPASVAAILLLVIVLGVFAIWLVLERLVAVAGAFLLQRGRRRLAGYYLLNGVAVTLVGGGVLLTMLSVLSLVIWSLSWRWTFPGLLPAEWSMAAWQGAADSWGARLMLTVGLAVLSTALAVTLAVAWLAATGGKGVARQGWIYLPLIVPQAVILPGIYAAMTRAGIPPGFGAVLWLHVVFVFPYVLLMIADPWRGFDGRYDRIAASLGSGAVGRLFRLRLPMLAATLASAAAVGVAVSVAQYLTTLFAGAGRVVTLTTEAVALSSGADRRIGAVYALLQTLIPLVGFLAASWVAPRQRRRVVA